MNTYAILKNMYHNEAGYTGSLTPHDFFDMLSACGVEIEPYGTNEVIFTGGKERTRSRLASLVDNNAKLKAGVILALAKHDANLLEAIVERACIRWCDGYSDSLFSAVLCGIEPTGEIIERNEKGEIILKEKSNWSNELANY